VLKHACLVRSAALDPKLPSGDRIGWPRSAFSTASERASDHFSLKFWISTSPVIAQSTTVPDPLGAAPEKSASRSLQLVFYLNRGRQSPIYGYA
jgi:hypothetical protein